MEKFAWYPIRLTANGATGSHRYWTAFVSYWRGLDGVAHHCALCDPAVREEVSR